MVEHERLRAAEFVHEHDAQMSKQSIFHVERSAGASVNEFAHIGKVDERARSTNSRKLA